MRQVTIYQLDARGNQVELGKCQLIGTQVHCQGERHFIERLISEGITDFSVEPSVTIYPDSGEKFLEQLQHNFRSGYFMATAPEDIFD